jgi:hypothetical protein
VSHGNQRPVLEKDGRMLVDGEIGDVRDIQAVFFGKLHEREFVGEEVAGQPVVEGSVQ